VLDPAAEAEALCKQALATYDQKLAAVNPSSARVLEALAQVYQEKRDYQGAAEFYQRSIKMYEQALGPENVELIPVLENYAALLRLRKRDSEAASVRDRARRIRLKALG
jgi:tetratricopeptide (TPR) repeat protein